MKNNIGKHLRKLRQQKKFTQGQLSSYSGVSVAAISKIEKGDRKSPNPIILSKLAKPLGVSFFELMYEAGYIEEDALNQIPGFKKFIVQKEYPQAVKYLIEKIENAELDERDQDILIGVIDVLCKKKLS